MDNAVAELREVIADLLERYEHAQNAVIYEYSGRIDEDEAELAQYLEDTRSRVAGIVSRT